MKAHRIETTLTENGTLLLKDLPFTVGEPVEIIVIKLSSHPSESNLSPRRGAVHRYDDPFGPATPVEDWEVLQ